MLGAGLLTPKFNKKNFELREREAEFERLAERRNEKKYGPRELEIAEAVAELAEVIGRSSAQVGLNWVRQKGTIPIIGTSKVSQIEDSLAALGWTLTEKEMQLLDEASNIGLGFPHDFFQSRNVKKAFWGSTFDQVDRVRPIAYVHPTRMAR